MTRPKYVLCPGMVTSQTDGQEHYIGPMKLAHLYGVDLRECEIFEPSPNWTTIMRWMAEERFRGLVTLRPRHDGNYALPACSQEIQS